MGFASPDSDYDVRFIYLRPALDYVRLDEQRDVIEWKNDQVLDINGLDLRKAMTLFARGNATLFEWSNSPVVYKTTDEWASVYDTAKACFSETTAVSHYYGIAMSIWSKHLTGETVRYKKYFYALRPLLAAQYIDRFHAVPPVLFDSLLKMEMDPALRGAIERLLEAKKVTTEGEYNPQIPEVRDFIREELPGQKMILQTLPQDQHPNWPAMNECFIRMLGIQAAGNDAHIQRNQRL